MTKLPDQDALGGLPSLSVPSGTPSIDLSAIGKAYQNLGAGVSKFGLGLNSMDDAQQTLAEKQAQADFSIAQDKLYYSEGQNEDYNSAPGNFQTAAQAALTNAATKIDDPTKRAAFIASNSVGLNHRTNLLTQHSTILYQKDTEAQNDEKLNDLAAQALENPDDTFRATKLQQAKDLIEAEGRAFHKTPTQVQTRLRNYVQKYGEAYTNDLIQRDPQGALDQLNKVTPMADPNVPGTSDSTGSGPQSGNFDPNSGGSQYLAGLRAPFKQELQDPQTRRLLAGVVSAENPGAGPAVVESLMNRTLLVNQDRQSKGLPPVTLKDMILGTPGIGGGKSFYGPVRNGAIADHLSKIDNNPAFAQRINGYIDEALAGSNTVQGYTDQGSARDPNYVTGGIGVNINGERFNNWGYTGSAEFTKNLQRQYAAANGNTPTSTASATPSQQPYQVASIAPTTMNDGTSGPAPTDTTVGTSSDTNLPSATPDASEGIPDTAPLDTSDDTKGTQVAANTKTGTPLDFLRPDQIVRLKAAAQRALKAKAIDDERADLIAKKQAEAVSSQREGEIIQDLTSNSPTVTVKQIGSDPQLTPAAQERMIGLAARLAKPGNKFADTYGTEFDTLWKRMSLPDGDPNKLTDPGTLTQYVGPENQLTMQGLDRLRAELAGRKTPEGAAEAKMKDQFLLNAKHTLSGTNDSFGIRDPKGDELYLKFLATALPAYDAGRAKGLSPAQLLDPDSSDYVGKGITSLKRSLSQRTSDMLGDGLGGNATLDPNSHAAQIKNYSDPANYTSAGDVVAAFQSGHVDRATASKILVQKGWAKAAPVVPPTPPGPQVPISQ